MFGFGKKKNGIMNNAQKVIDRNVEYADVFEPTQRIYSLEVDEVNELWRVQGVINRYDEIIDYKLVQDDEEVTSGGLGIGRAMVGGVMAGGVGALLGGLTKKKKSNKYVTNLHIRINHTFHGQRKTSLVKFISKKTKLNSGAYHILVDQAEGALRLLDEMTSIEESQQVESAADELLKYKELLDMDAITIEEFEDVKKKILL